MPEEKEGEFTTWDTGYRSWKFGRSAEGKPRLRALMSGVPWEPIDVEDVDPFGSKVVSKEVRSDWKEGEDEPFSETSKGLYSLKSLKEALQHYGGSDVYGAITPYGKTYYGTSGYRSQFAKVRTLYKDSVKCYVCHKPAKYYIRDNETFPICERCLKRIEKYIRGKGYTEVEVEEFLRLLAEEYDAEVAEMPFTSEEEE